MKRIFWLLLLFMMMSSCATTSPQQSLVNRALDAMGGAD